MCNKSCMYCGQPRYIPYAVCQTCLKAERAAEAKRCDLRRCNLPIAQEHGSYTHSQDLNLKDCIFIDVGQRGKTQWPEWLP